MTGTAEIHVEANVEIVTLSFAEQEIKIAVQAGNTLFSWKVKGKEKLWFPYTVEEYLQTTSLAGNPFMYPWANRLEKNAIPLQHLQVSLEDTDVYRDAKGLPLHGLLLKSPFWKTSAIEQHNASVLHRARLQFDGVESYMKIFPIRHWIEMVHRLDESGVSMEVRIQNEDEAPLPLSFGFHPYFSYQGIHPSQVAIRLPFRQRFITDDRLIPDGRLEPVGDHFRKGFSILHHPLDDGFTDIAGEPVMWLDVAGESIAVEMDKAYQVGVVYAPQSEKKPYVCLEPMLAPVNALYLNEKKLWNGLKWLQKDESFTANFRLRAW